MRLTAPVFGSSIRRRRTLTADWMTESVSSHFSPVTDICLQGKRAMYFTYKSFKKFCKENIPVLILIPIITFLAYGGKIFYQTISFDLEFLMDDPEAFYSSWITLHRWALIPYKFLSGTWNFNMPMEITYTIVNPMLAMFLFGVYQ